MNIHDMKKNSREIMSGYRLTMPYGGSAHGASGQQHVRTCQQIVYYFLLFFYQCCIKCLCLCTVNFSLQKISKTKLKSHICVPYFLVFDDIIYNSRTRRDQPCWFRVPKVGMIAANDGVLLRNHIPCILRKHFKGKPYYVELLDLFNEVEFQTAAGQMIDLITTQEGEKDLSKYTLSLHRRIVQYKTAYYSLKLIPAMQFKQY